MLLCCFHAHCASLLLLSQTTTNTTASALISTDTPGTSSSSGTLTSSSANSSDNQLYKALQLRTDVAGCLADLLLHNMYAIMHGQQGASMKEEVQLQLVELTYFKRVMLRFIYTAAAYSIAVISSSSQLNKTIVSLVVVQYIFT
jgi:aspartyl/asparaginyl-tRNA synthetase